MVGVVVVVGNMCDGSVGSKSGRSGCLWVVFEIGVVLVMVVGLIAQDQAGAQILAIQSKFLAVLQDMLAEKRYKVFLVYH